MTAPDVTILIITDREDPHWCDSAKKILHALESATTSLATAPTLRTIDVEDACSTRDQVEGLQCIICHPTPRGLNAVARQGNDALLLFVSGGERPAETFLHERTSKCQTIWFSGVYGREGQFEPWLLFWAERGLAKSSFTETSEALFSGKTGLGITAGRLRGNLIPVMFILEAFDALITKEISELTKVSIRQRVITALSQAWNEDRLCERLCADAALLYGGLKNLPKATRPSFVRLAELLQDFLPRFGFHQTYEPQLNESIRSIISGANSTAAIDDIICAWHRKLAELASLLDAFPARVTTIQ